MRWSATTAPGARTLGSVAQGATVWLPPNASGHARLCGFALLLCCADARVCGVRLACALLRRLQATLPLSRVSSSAVCTSCFACGRCLTRCSAPPMRSGPTGRWAPWSESSQRLYDTLLTPAEVLDALTSLQSRRVRLCAGMRGMRGMQHGMQRDARDVRHTRCCIGCARCRTRCTGCRLGCTGCALHLRCPPPCRGRGAACRRGWPRTPLRLRLDCVVFV